MSCWIQLEGGSHYDFSAPFVSPRITIDSIAHSLARLCRFNGHTNEFYSVAEHSVRCSYLVEPELELIAFAHDWHESLVGDVTSPLKRMLPGFEVIDRMARMHVSVSMGVDIVDLDPRVIHADLQMLSTEKRDLLDPIDLDWDLKLPEPLSERIRPWGIREAHWRFLKRFKELSHGLPVRKEEQRGRS